MALSKNISGLQFGRLIAKNKLGKDKFGIALWNCQCSCGNEYTVRLSSLTAGATKSCGCLNDEVRKERFKGNSLARTHSLSDHYLYQTWSTMKQRCNNPRSTKYHLYGMRGIRVSEEWEKSFETFLSDMGDRPVGFTLDRKNPNGDYCKENCKWSSVSDQNRNRRSYTKSIK